MMTRRLALQKTLVLSAACSSAGVLRAAAPAAPDGPFKLAPLPYPADALEPHIDAQTMTIHHGRHHAAYLTNLNKAVAGQARLAGQTIEQILKNLDEAPEAVRGALRNHGGGHYNHTLFWRMMSKSGGGQPKGALAKAIDKKFGNFEGFQTQFTEAASKVFGSGWAWLTLADGELKIQSTPNQDTPLSKGHLPLLGLDVWEHAYYLKYQNKRADYLAAFYNVIHWDFVAERFEKPPA